MQRRTAQLLAAAVLVLTLFWFANRGAYKGFFQDDDLDNLGWTIYVEPTTFAGKLISPFFSRGNFRPVGHGYFHVMEAVAGTYYPAWVLALQGLHVLTAIAVFSLAVSVGAGAWSAFAAACLFLFHPATFDAYWRPMFVFDVTCALFSVLSLLAWTRKRWILSFVAFWLAYKSKELAVMLPFVLLAYEWLMGRRRWKLLLPFFATSLSFGLQAMIANRGSDDAYTLRLTPEALAITAPYYLSAVLGIAWAGILLIAIPIWLRDRRAWLGVAGFLALLAPLLALPARLFTVYLYAPLALLMITMAVAFDRIPKPAVAAVVAAWCAFTFTQMREYRNTALAIAQENRAYFGALAAYHQKAPHTNAFVYDGSPSAMHEWGISGALNYLRRDGTRVTSIDSEQAQSFLHERNVALLLWDPASHHLDVIGKGADTPDRSYVEIGRLMPVWQFGDGWYATEERFRWTKPVAHVRLYRPVGAKTLELYVRIGEGQMQSGAVHLQVLLDGQQVLDHQFQQSDWQMLKATLPPGPAGTVDLELKISPPFRPPNDPRLLGVAISRFGFTT